MGEKHSQNFWSRFPFYRKYKHHMRIYILALLSLFILAACGKKKAEKKAEAVEKKEQEDGVYTFNKEKPYPYETGIIEYKYTGGLEGSQIIYFKDYGRVLSVEENYVNKTAPVAARTHQLFINTPDKYYFINLETKLGYVAQRNDSAVKEQVNLLGDITSIGIDSTMNKNGYTPSGTTDIAGKKCRVYKSATGESEFCFWEGMNIRTQMSLGPNVKYKLEAVKINENAKVPEDKFTPPSDAKMLDYIKYLKEETRDKL
jgi:hypothetical protein